MTWRKAWEKNWDSIKMCSAACRKRGRRRVDDELEAAILELLDGRARSATICPSEAARLVGSRRGDAKSDPDAWRSLMEPARCAARRLVARGEVVITQKGNIVDPSTAKGPIRIRTASGGANAMCLLALLALTLVLAACGDSYEAENIDARIGFDTDGSGQILIDVRS